MKKIYLLCLLTTLASCQLMPTAKKVVILKSTFDKESFVKQLEATGNNTIKGSALIRQRGGGIVTCAGNQVFLLPVTEYSSERVMAIYGNLERAHISNYVNNIVFDPENLDYGKSTRPTLCNVQGFFTFNNVKDGEYYVISTITWEVPISAYSTSTNGGSMFQKISVKKNQIVDVILTP